MKKIYIMPSIQIVLVEPQTLLAGTEHRGWAQDGKLEDEYQRHIGNKDVSINVYPEDEASPDLYSDGFLDID